MNVLRHLAFAIALLVASQSANAQAPRPIGTIGIGAQAGSPTGLTAKYYARKDVGLVFLGSWNLERFLLFSMHITYEYPIPDSPLRFFVGPGIDVGREGDDDESALRLGLSVMPGLNFFTERFEVFLHAMPTVQLGTRNRFELGGAVGLRYFF